MSWNTFSLPVIFSILRRHKFNWKSHDRAGAVSPLPVIFPNQQLRVLCRGDSVWGIACQGRAQWVHILRGVQGGQWALWVSVGPLGSRMGWSHEFKSQNKEGGSRLGQGKVSDQKEDLTPVKGKEGRSRIGQGEPQTVLKILQSPSQPSGEIGARTAC